MPILSFGGGSHLGAPCRGARLGLFEQEREKNPTNIQQACEYQAPCARMYILRVG